MCQRNPAIMRPNECRQAHSPADGLALSGPGNGTIQIAQRRPISMERGRTHDVIDGSIIPTSLPASSYRTCIRREVPPRCTSSVVFLDRLFSLCLVAPQEREAGQQHRSSLFVRLCASSVNQRDKAKQTSGRPRVAMLDINQHGEPPSEQPGQEVRLTTLARGANREAATVRFLPIPKPSPASKRRQNADEASLAGRSLFHHTFDPGPATRAHSWTEEPRECPARPSAYLSHLNCLEDSPKSLSLKEALELFRPDFISRSQGRVRRMEQRARRRRRRALQVPGLGTGRGTPRKNCTTPDPLSDNLFKPRDRSISGREMQRRSRRMYNRLPEVEKKKQEEEKRAVSQANRLRADLFKKRLLEQILQR